MASSVLPFCDLSENEFLREIGSWVFHCASNLESKDLFADVIVNPENNDAGSINYNIESPYCDVKRTAKELK